jgi:dihydrolipoamide dehydrogenase
LVVGGGYIGLELGIVYAALGSQVVVVELTGGLLPGVDRDLVRPLQRRLEGLFEAIHLNTKVERLERHDGKIHARLCSETEERTEQFDRVLIAVGRRPNTADLGLENAGITVDPRGFIVVNDRFQTNLPHVYAVGDAAGEPMLAHKASHEAKVAVAAILGPAAPERTTIVPAVVFTDPEIAWCGVTETQAKAAERPVTIMRYPWAASGRAQTIGRTDGLTKLICDATTQKVLGVGIVGPGAGELIAEATLAVQNDLGVHDLAHTVHTHPTLAETLGEAAEAVLGQATHLYRPRR